MVVQNTVLNLELTSQQLNCQLSRPHSGITIESTISHKCSLHTRRWYTYLQWNQLKDFTSNSPLNGGPICTLHNTLLSNCISVNAALWWCKILYLVWMEPTLPATQYNTWWWCNVTQILCPLAQWHLPQRLLSSQSLQTAILTCSAVLTPADLRSLRAIY